MKKAKQNINTNPLLSIQQFPDYIAINPKHALPAIQYLIEQNKQQLENILANKEATWQIYEQIEAMNDKLSKAWSPISHLHSVNNNEQWRAAYQDCQQIMSLYDAEMSQHSGLYEFYCNLSKNDEFANYNAAQQKIINDTILDFELSGVSLLENDKETYRKLMQSASELSMTFSNNVLDATQSFQVWIDDINELSGLPEYAITLYEQLAQQFKEQYQKDKAANLLDDGEIEPTATYCITLDFPSYYPIMSQCSNRQLREQVYTAYVTRASDKGPNANEFDNTAIIDAILSIREDLAKLLGFEDYANLSLINKMAKKPAKVFSFLNDLVAKAKPIAQQEYAELKAFATTQFNMNELAAWDITYVSEQLKQQKYSISEEQLREYFPLSKVMSGLFTLTKQLFDVDFKEINHLSVWNPDVKTYAVLENGIEIAYFYLDLYSRQGKSGGAWMNGAVDRIQSSLIKQLPVAYLVCNFTQPSKNNESYLTHQEINTLFHEFGHGLHHMLTRVNYASASGINGVEWDAVELPSQFMENFCYQKEVIMNMSEHKENQQPLPEGLFENLIRSKNYQSALMMIRQLEFSLFDMQIHDKNIMNDTTDVMQILQKLRAAIAVTPSPEFARFPMSFSHIFAGGYAAGYYSYKWAEVLSADAFAKFEELGIYNKQVRELFKSEILSMGSARTANENFIAFRNREPDIQALLRHNGITK